MAKHDNRESYFVCCMVLLVAEERFFVSQETVHGELTLSPRGEGGFGYDPIFYLPGQGKTMAEMEDHEKDLISHRGRAAKKMLKIISLDK